MLAQLDPRVKKFYLEMGYSEKQIQQALECSRSTGVDMLDALAMTQDPPPLPKVQPQKPSLPEPPQQQGAYVPPKSFNYRSTTTFMTPWNKLRINDYQTFFSRSAKSSQTAKIELREEDYPVGLLNVSNCCYLNSLLQCYYLMNSFKVAILTAEPLPNLEQALAAESKTKLKRIKSQYELLGQFKQFFTTMGLTSKRYLDPTSVLQNLVDSVGEKVSYGEEKDLSEINILIIERLSEGLQHSKNHYRPEEKEEDLLDLNFADTGSTIIHRQSKKPYNSIFNPRQGAIKKMFYGTRVQYYDQQKLQKDPPIVSDFAGLILHPQGGNLTRALEEEFNFQVELNGQLHKKTTFIRDQPEYLFLYINRTDFDRQEGQATKNQHKFTFDFTFYLDRYLQKYRKENDHSHQKIKDLLATKNKLKEQISYLQILFKKVEECQKYAQELEGWTDKLPKEEEFQEEYRRLEEKLGTVEKELDQIESRKEEYHLMYIFVHRGDAVSGHYWGYGRNDKQWYRFDINTSTVEQDQIVIDLEKSAATPYALLYVKSSNLPNFDYKLHVNTDILKEKYPVSDFRGCFDPKTATQIIQENQRLRQETLIRNQKALKYKAYNDYVSRVGGVKKLVKRNEEQNKKSQQLLKVSIVNNFSLFLWTHEQVELAKFIMFEQALLTASSNKINIDSLMHQKEILQMIQKKFKKSCHGDLCLKFYSLLPKEVEKLVALYQEYQLHEFEVIWGSVILNGAELFQDQWTAEKAKANGNTIHPSETVKRLILKLLKLLRIRKSFWKSPQVEDIKKEMNSVLYISQINNEVSKILMLAISATGLKIQSLQQFIDVSDQVGAQIAAINAENDFELDTKDIREEKKNPVEEAKEFVTSYQSLGSKKNQRRSASPSITKMEEKRSPAKSGFKNSFLASPSKTSKVNQSEQKEKKVETMLVTSQKKVLVLDSQEQWRSEQLDTLKINFQFGPKLINFLKKMNPIPKIYKKLTKLQKPLSLAQLKHEGFVINQEQQQVMEESLI